MKNTFRRIVAFVAVLALILSETVCFLATAEAQAATKKLTLTVANRKLIVKDGKRQIKTYTVNSGSTFCFVDKGKKLSRITYRSSAKKVLTVSKKGVVSKKDAEGKSAKVRISAKYKKKRIKVNLKITIKEKSTVVPSVTDSPTKNPDISDSSVQSTETPTVSPGIPTPMPTPDVVSSATQSTEAPTEKPQVTMEPENEPTEVPQASAEPTEPKSKEKTLVVYFSRAGENYNVGIVDKGNTAIIAEKIAEKTGADVFEILAENPYPTGYEDCKTRATNERNDGVRPKYIGDVEDWSSYSLVFLGYPIWWGDAPRIMSTFVESHSFEGKTVVPFCTSGSSSIGRSGSNLAARAGSGNWLDGERFSGSVTEDEIQSWIDGLR